jgi:uncharacterized protein (TIGR03083 family)
MAGETVGATTTEALQDAASRVSGLLRSVQRPDAPVPGMNWTVSETAAHMVAELADYAAFARGDPNLAGPAAPEDSRTAAQRNAAANAAQLTSFAERDLSRLADRVVPAADDFIAAAEARTGESILATNGLFVTIPTMTAMLLGEVLIHGLDVARAAHLSWRISQTDALHVIAGIMAIVPDYIDRQRAAGLHVSYELRMRGGARYRIAVDDGAAAVTAPGPRADCWISADPAAFLLVGYGRTGQWTQIARGKLIAGGRKPWLGLAFAQLITAP